MKRIMILAIFSCLSLHADEVVSPAAASIPQEITDYKTAVEGQGPEAALPLSATQDGAAFLEQIKQVIDVKNAQSAEQVRPVVDATAAAQRAEAQQAQAQQTGLEGAENFDFEEEGMGLAQTENRTEDAPAEQEPLSGEEMSEHFADVSV